jgi:hypothetical protein
VTVASQKLATFTKTLTSEQTCTLNAGTTQSVVSDDSYTQRNNTSTNSGTATGINVKSNTTSANYGWIRFDPTSCSLPANVQIDSAVLTLTASSASGRTVAVYPVSATWAQGTITWSNQPAVSGTATSSATVATTTNWDVSPDVARWVGGLATNYGWSLRDTGSSSTTTTTFRSREYTTTGQRPKLVIKYVS